MAPPPPDGLDGVIATFGDIHRFIRSDGTISPRWEEEMIQRIRLPRPLILSGTTSTQITKLTSHKLITDVLRQVMRDIDDAGIWPSLGTYGGGFNFRRKRTADQISLHAWGIAWDFDPEHNKLGTAGSMDPEVVRIVNSHGFLWGGSFKKTKDPMHFQYATGV